MPTGVYPRTEYHKKIIGQSKKGQIPWNKNKPWSKKVKTKISISNKGKKKIFKNSELHSKNLSKALKGNKNFSGKKHTEYSKKKMAIHKIGDKNPAKRLAVRLKLSKATAAYHAKNGNKNKYQKNGYTKIEKILYQALKNYKINFIPQYLIKERFVVDAFLPNHNIIIQADGDYWHNIPKQKIRDKSVNAYLTKCGYKIYRFWEKDIKLNINKCIKQINL